MRIGAVILARFDSARLPGKVLADVGGKPLLWYVIARCRAVRAVDERIVVATSDRPVDDALAEYASSEGLAVFRGDAEDVAGRFLAAAQVQSYEAVARINADCPLTDPGLLARGCATLEESTVDFVTNLQPRTFPYGIVLEVFRTEAFAAGYARMSMREHLEHVTKYFYDTLGDHRFVNLKRSDSEDETREMLRYRLTVDTADHLERFRAFVVRCRAPWAEVDYMDAVAFGGFG